jgi:RecB family exonuclease
MRLSFSQLDSYSRCPKQYEFAYIKKLPRQQSSPESFGSSVHNTMKAWGELEMQHQNPQQPQMTLFGEVEIEALEPLTLDTLQRLWQKHFSPFGYDTPEDKHAAFERGKRVIDHAFTWWSLQPRTPYIIEKGFKVPLTSDTLLHGRYDRVEQVKEGFHVFDFKTGRVHEQAYADNAPQLSLYAHAINTLEPEPCVALSLVFLDENGVVERTTKRSTEDIEAFLSSSQSTHQLIATGEFTATPTKSGCSWCPYRNVCEDAI